jgi:hypothetical protein
MSSNIVSVGNKAGKSVFTFTASGQDTGSLMAPVENGGDLLRGLRECTRWNKWLLQLTGTGIGYAVTLFGTIDVATAFNEPGNNAEWFELPSPSVESGFSWSNPLMLSPGGRACYVNTPLVAIRAVSSTIIGFTISGTVSLLAFVEPG